MKVEESQIKKLRITEVDNLDPIDVFVDEISSTAGKITINCYGESWTGFWPAMGERGLVDFFKASHNEYLIGYLDSSLQRKTEDWDAYKQQLKARCDELNGENKEAMLDAIDDMDEERLAEELRISPPDEFDCREILLDSGELQYSNTLLLPDDIEVSALFVEPMDIPKQDHHKFVYLSRIVDAVKAAL